MGSDVVQFIKQPNGTYTPPAGVTMKLTQLSSSPTYSYQLDQRGNGNTFLFDLNTKRLSKINERLLSFRTMLFNYLPDGRLSTVQDCWTPARRTLTFNYDTGTPSRLISINDDTGRSVVFAYANTYSTEGDLVGVTDPENKTWSYEYDGDHKILRTKEPTASGPRIITQNLYDTDGKVIEQRSEGDNAKLWKLYVADRVSVEKDPLGGRTMYFYDEKQRMIAKKDANGNKSSTIFDGQNHPVQQITPKGEVTTFEHNGDHNVTKITDPLLRERTFTYDALLRLERETDFRGKETTYEYFPQDAEYAAVSKITKPPVNNDPGMPNITLYTFTTLSHVPNVSLTRLPRSITDPDGKVTTFDYDSYGQVRKLTYHNGDFEEFVNNARGDIISHKDAERGTETMFEYNKRRQLTKTTVIPTPANPPNNIVTERIYDDAGNLWKTKDAKDNFTIHTYSATKKHLNQTLPTVAAGTPTIVNTYDNRDWLQSTANPLTETTTFTHDAGGRQTDITDPLLRNTHYAYDNNGQRTSAKSPLVAQNQTVTYAYNARGETETQTDASGFAINYTYDENGSPLTARNRNNGTFGSTFYDDGRLWTSKTPLLKTTTHTYYKRGLPATITEPSLQQTTMTYDDRGRLATKIDPAGSSTYTYDKNNNLLTHVENAKTITRVYDELNRLVSYTDESGNVLGYQYDKNGNLTRLIYPGGTKYVDYAYDNLNQLITVTDWASRQTAFTYDLAGRPKTITRPNGTVREITYNAAGETVKIRELAPNGVPLALFQLDYDEAGRIKGELIAPLPQPFTESAQTITHDADNRMATFNGTTVVHDDDGNMTSGPLNSSTAVAHTYDARNRLTAVGASGAAPALAYIYDSEGNRRTSLQGGQITTFAINPAAALSQVLVRTRPGGIKTYYVYGAGLLYEVNDAGNTLTYHYDYRGSTVALTDGTGNVLERMEYSAYGRTTWRGGSTDTPFLYNGRYGVMTDANGLLNMRARYYNPYIRRFLNADPIQMAGGMNWYAYADGNPVSYLDPFGLGANQAWYEKAGHWVTTGVGNTVDWVIGKDFGAAWFNMFSEPWVNGPTGGFLPQSLADGLWDVRRVVDAEAANAAANGMHAWHAGSNAYLQEQLGVGGVPIIFWGGVFHESPLDWGSFQAEQHWQGTVNHFLDSATDIVANVFGLATGVFLPESVSVGVAARVGNYIPGPGEPDPAFGGRGGPYKGNPTDAWGHYP